jgi:uncharacterized protein (DUF2062 family)
MDLRYLAVRYRLCARSLRRFILRKVLHADDPPHKLALGVALGVFLAFTPTVGFQTLLVVFFAWVLRANKVVGLPLVWITNPATIVPIYYSCYIIGRLLLGQQAVARQWWMEFASPPQGWWERLTFYWQRLMDIACPLVVGSLVVAAALGALSYGVVYRAIRWYRTRRRLPRLRAG